MHFLAGHFLRVSVTTLCMHLLISWNVTTFSHDIACLLNNPCQPLLDMLNLLKYRRRETSFSNVKDRRQKTFKSDENVNANKVSRYDPYHSFREKKMYQIPRILNITRLEARPIVLECMTMAVNQISPLQILNRIKVGLWLYLKNIISS